MTTKIKYDNINYIKLKYDASYFTLDQNTRLVRNEGMFFKNIDRRVPLLQYCVILCWYLKVLFGCVAV